MTSPNEPVSFTSPLPSMTATSTGIVSPPTLVHARPVTTPISSLPAFSSGLNFLGPRKVSMLSALTETLAHSPPAILTAAFLQRAAMSCSSLLTPDSLV